MEDAEYHEAGAARMECGNFGRLKPTTVRLLFPKWANGI